MRILAILLTVLTIAGVQPAQAAPLLDACVVAEADLEPMIFLASNSPTSAIGMSCETLKNFSSAAEWVQLSIIPTILAAKMTGIPEALLAANPAVLGVTVIGASGAIVVYVVMKASLEECAAMEKEQLKKEIMKELSQKYGLKAKTSTLTIGDMP